MTRMQKYHSQSISEPKIKFNFFNSNWKTIGSWLLVIWIVLHVWKFVLLVIMDTIAELLVGTGTSCFLYFLAVCMWVEPDKHD